MGRITLLQNIQQSRQTANDNVASSNSGEGEDCAGWQVPWTRLRWQRKFRFDRADGWTHHLESADDLPQPALTPAANPAWSQSYLLMLVSGSGWTFDGFDNWHD